MFRTRLLRLCCLALLALPAAAPPPAPTPAPTPQVVAAAEQEGSVVVYSTTDSKIADPLLKDFAALYPKIKVEYNDLNSTELYNRFISEVAAGGGSGDVLWSSAMDLQMKLANDGYAAAYQTPEADQLPPWSIWKGEAYGTTFEPIVFVYNKRLLKPEEAPQTHADLTKLLRAQPDRFKGKLTAYDPERSGVGFLLLTQDARTDPAYEEAAARLRQRRRQALHQHRRHAGADLVGRAHPRLQHLLLLRPLQAEEGPVARVRLPQGLHAGDVAHRRPPQGGAPPERVEGLPRLPALRPRPGDRGPRVGLGSIRSDVTGEGTAAALGAAMGSTLKPIPVSPALLVYLDQAKRLEFLNKWQQALGTK